LPVPSKYKRRPAFIPVPEGWDRLPVQPLWLGFAVNTAFYAAILSLLTAGLFALRGLLRTGRGLCPACAYPRGESDVCSECGKALPGRAYDQDILVTQIQEPRLGWLLTIILPIVVYFLALPILALLGFPVGFVANLFFIVWFVHVNKRVAAWRYDVRMRGFRQGTNPKPGSKYRSNLERLLLAFDVVALLGLWGLGAELFGTFW